MITVLLWKWKAPGHPGFGPEYVNRMRNMLARHLELPHRVVCATDDPTGIHPAVECIPITEFTDRPRCQRRMAQYGGRFAERLGARILSIDLDVVIVDDITPIVDIWQPIVCWKVGYAGVYCGSFVLYDAWALDDLYKAFAADPDGYSRRAQPHGVSSDQPMLNYFLRGKPIPFWTEADGFVTWFGRGYQKYEHLGMSKRRPQLSPGARIVVLGSADKAEMDEGRHAFIREHWR